MPKVELNWEKVIPAPIPTRHTKIVTRDPYHSLAATYTSNIYRAAPAESKLFREKVAADLKRLGIGL